MFLFQGLTLPIDYLNCFQIMEGSYNTDISCLTCSLVSSLICAISSMTSLFSSPYGKFKVKARGYSLDEITSTPNNEIDFNSREIAEFG